MRFRNDARMFFLAWRLAVLSGIDSVDEGPWSDGWEGGENEASQGELGESRVERRPYRWMGAVENNDEQSQVDTECSKKDRILRSMEIGSGNSSFRCFFVVL